MPEARNEVTAKLIHVKFFLRGKVVCVGDRGNKMYIVAAMLCIKGYLTGKQGIMGRRSRTSRFIKI